MVMNLRKKKIVQKYYVISSKILTKMHSDLRVVVLQSCKGESCFNTSFSRPLISVSEMMKMNPRTNLKMINFPIANFNITLRMQKA